jgi:radical SAM superfamily enzyme YgiQ (UPF0313 family)
MTGMVRALLISTYELGHQPFGLASPAAWLVRDGVSVECADLAKDKLDEESVRRASLIAFHLPMHTATRMAAPVIARVKALNATARICAYGLYAPLNAEWLRTIGVDDVLGGEFEADLAGIAQSITSGNGSPVGEAHEGVSLPKLQFVTPDRSGLPPLTRYSTLQLGDGTQRVSGYTEASRGCRHLCRHCPVVPVYKGQFRVVQPDVVLADIGSQVKAGAQHITFGDPDFFNGPTHAVRVVERLHSDHPSLTYDVTIKVEHLLRHRDLLPRLAGTGCLFVTSAVESIDDAVLVLLEKGHTRRDFETAVALCRAANLPLVPTFVAFHPWTSLDGYCDLLDAIATLGLIDHVAPIQLAIRLLVPSGSRLLEQSEMREFVTGFDPRTLTHVWVHTDPRVDELQVAVSALVGGRLTSHRRELFAAISALAHERAGRPLPEWPDRSQSAAIPQFDEPWYCCAEPNPELLRMV